MPITCHIKELSFRSVIVLLVAVILGLSAIGVTIAANGSVSYIYDALGRMSIASYDTGVCITYSYDANGNRLSEVVRVGAGSVSTGYWGCFNWNAASWGAS